MTGHTNATEHPVPIQIEQMNLHNICYINQVALTYLYQT